MRTSFSDRLAHRTQLAPATDQRGVARPQGGGFDIGAVERQPSDVDTVPRLWLPLLRR